LRIKPAEKEKLKTLPPPEDDIDPDGVINSTIVEDSDDDEREVPVPIPVVLETTPVVEQLPIVTESVVLAEEPKKKRVISKKLKVEN
jgi:hypothetical protein